MKRRAALALAFAVSASPLAARAGSGLDPSQMMHSLELLQDRIAGGDQAALPMQRKLLELVDARIRGMADVEFASGQNRRAVLIYAMSGGNPATVEVALTRIGRDDPDRKLGNAIMLYLQGQPQTARRAMERVDPMKYTPELGAYLALVKGSVLAGDDAQKALTALDQARLLAPGTLVEEAALRRTVAVAATAGDGKRFLRASEQYVRSYLRSPYASQFADAFVAGVVTLDKKVGLDAVGEIAGLMDPEREKVIYLRIARQAAIDGSSELSAYASAKAEEHSNDPRAILYGNLAAVTSATVEDARAKLERLDRSRLSESDRRLLDAALAVSADLVEAPREMLLPATESKAPTAAPPKAEAKPAAPVAVVEPHPAPAAAHDSPPADPGIPDAVPEEAAMADAGLPAQERFGGDTPPAATAELDKSAATAAADPTELMMANARRKLDDIDKLIGDMPE